MRAVVTLIVVLMASPAAAQTCVPTVGFTSDASFWRVGNGSIPDRVAAPAKSRVPAGQLWMVESYGIGYQGDTWLFADAARDLSGSIVMVHSDGVGGMFGWPLGRWAGHAPSLSGHTFGHRELILTEGEGLGLRLDAWWDNQAAFVTFIVKYYAYPAACLSSLKGETVSVTMGPVTPPPDFTALRNAALDAAAKLTTLAQSAP